MGLIIAIIAAGTITVATALLSYISARQRGLDLWLPTYILTGRRRRWQRGTTEQPIHVLLSIADHHEPRHGRVSAVQAASRVESWTRQYPALFGEFRDADGRPPQHTFFFPIDEYDPLHVVELAKLCRAGFGEIEIHHHHDHDTSEALRQRLLDFKRLFHDEHGLLPVDSRRGEVKYGFVHGNWALDNSRPDGRWCGVDNELDVLRETGCYADFTLPSAPSRTQTATINSIYYAIDDPERPKSHNRGVPVGAGPPPDDALMLIQGPLLLNWRNRTGPRRLLPRIENGNIQASQPPSMARLDLWMRAGIQVRSRPDWLFVKLYTHGAPEANQAVLLGRAMIDFHAALAERATSEAGFHFHYVTAREMYNLVRAAEAGWTGSVQEARDFELVWRA